MLSSDYLIKGITGLSRASQGSPMEGHYGAAVIAAYYFCRENDLDKKTEKAVQKQIDQLISKFEPFFISLPAEDPEPGAISHIIQALDVNVHELRAIGHNVILLRWRSRPSRIRQAWQSLGNQWDMHIN
jgi:hypothetical protein